ncbi:MAG: enoyl-CoA hydratase [Subtercola sp.]|nr:enoyl-CoA hydratase [Subtercola sp.]
MAPTIEDRVLLSDGVVRTEQIGSILLITLNRPEARNAMTTEAATALSGALELLTTRDDLRVGVLTGAGKAFCAGQDLKAFSAGEPIIPVDHPEWGFGGFVGNFTPKPVIAAVHGFALGGGFELALACDLIVAAEGSKFGLPEVTRGLFAAGGGVPRVAQQLPLKVAMRMLLTGQPMSAEQAERWGLVNEVVPEGILLATALEIAQQISENAPLSIQTTKKLVYSALNESLWERESWVPVYEGIDLVFSSADAAEGAQAFVEKRKPVWTGR